MYWALSLYSPIHSWGEASESSKTPSTSWSLDVGSLQNPWSHVHSLYSPGNGRGECRLCLWPRERASSCVLTERKQSWVARWCPVNVRQQACFTDCLYFLCALPDDASAPHIGFCLNGVGSVGRVPVTKATKCYAFSTQCVLFFK